MTDLCGATDQLHARAHSLNGSLVRPRSRPFSKGHLDGGAARTAANPDEQAHAELKSVLGATLTSSDLGSSTIALTEPYVGELPRSRGLRRPCGLHSLVGAVRSLPSACVQVFGHLPDQSFNPLWSSSGTLLPCWPERDFVLAVSSSRSCVGSAEASAFRSRNGMNTPCFAPYS